jgi:hypothetical protein
MDVTTMEELNGVVERFIRMKFNETLSAGTGKVCINVNIFNTLDKFVYYTVHETIDITAINYNTLGIESIYICVRRDMLAFIEHTYELNGNERELGIVEQYLVGYYILSYIMTRM